MNSYKKVMDQIKADDEFRESLKLKLEAEQKSNKRKQTGTASRFYPLVAAVASAAVLLLVFSFSRAYILPLLRYDAYDGAGADKYSPIQLSPHDDEAETDIKPDSAVKKETVEESVTGNNENTQTDVPETDDSLTTPLPPETDTAEDSKVQDRHYGEEFMQPPQSTMSYKIVSFAGFDESLQSESDNTVNYDTLIHFTFDGFEEYDIGLYRNDMLLVATLPNDYTLADFFREYYDAIVAAEGMTDIQNGIVESFFGISTGSRQQINVYAEGIEVLNLETTPMSRFKDMSYVYLTVSVV